MPTVNCLVELVDVPSTVVTMADVGIVNLERVGFSLRNFDMTLVYKVSTQYSFNFPPQAAVWQHLYFMCDVHPYMAVNAIL